MSKKINTEALQDIMNGAEVSENRADSSAKTTPTFERGRINGRKVSIGVTISFSLAQHEQLQDYLAKNNLKATELVRQVLIEKGIIEP